jgi:pyruvate/2-oxoglutarate dehydrogenase complex dihydrolipoamide acyltransferase (E2) component
MPITLCVDHRIADGMVAARFLAALVAYLESLR